MSEGTPPGSVMGTVGSMCEVYVQLDAQVDVEREISRLEEKIAKKASMRDKLVEVTESEGYKENKVCNFKLV